MVGRTDAGCQQFGVRCQHSSLAFGTLYIAILLSGTLVGGECVAVDQTCGQQVLRMMVVCVLANFALTGGGEDGVG